MGAGALWKKPDVGFGAGVKPTAGLMNSRDNLISHGRARAEPPVSPHMEGLSGFRNPGNLYNKADISEAQGIYDRAEARRQEKLDALAELAQGKGGSGGGVRGQIVGDGGDLNIQHTAMNRGKDGFPTLADFEQPLHTFMGKRKLNLKGYA